MMEGRRVDRSLCLLTNINSRRKEIDKLWELCSESGFLCGPLRLGSQGHALRLCASYFEFWCGLDGIESKNYRKKISETVVERDAYGGTMKAVAFRSKVHPDGTILLPKKVRRSIKGDEVRVILLWPESVDDASLWEQESIKTFLEGDGRHDALYDTL
jgi:hypothetical protein